MRVLSPSQARLGLSFGGVEVLLVLAMVWFLYWQSIRMKGLARRIITVCDFLSHFLDEIAVVHASAAALCRLVMRLTSPSSCSRCVATSSICVSSTGYSATTASRPAFSSTITLPEHDSKTLCRWTKPTEATFEAHDRSMDEADR